MKALIIAATKLELDWLIARLKAAPQPPLLDFPVWHSDSAVLTESGPGMANAAAACAAAIERYRPERICNTGICGVYAHDRTLLGKTVIGTAAIFADTGAAGDAEFMTLCDMSLPLAAAAGSSIYNSIALKSEGIARNILRADFLTVAAVSASPARAAQLCSRFAPSVNWLLCEDMESAAVALIALRAHIPCSVVRGISNLCGERDHAAWKIQEAAQAAQETLHLMLSP